jgi:low affinity Fe/Cu permease
MHDAFRKFANSVAEFAGTPWVFLTALSIIVIWVISGPVFQFSDTWQLIINTGTTIITFLMVFLIQNTQNRDAKAMHLKLDEIIKSTKNARNALVDIENATDSQMKKVEREFTKLGHKRERQ